MLEKLQATTHTHNTNSTLTEKIPTNSLEEWGIQPAYDF